MFDTVKNIYGVFDDSRFKNTSYTMTVYNQTNVEGLSKYGTNVKMDMIVRLLSITETEYYYLKALNLSIPTFMTKQLTNLSDIPVMYMEVRE